MSKTQLIINDDRLASWLWENGRKLEQIERILAQKKSKEVTIDRIKRVLNSNTQEFTK